MIYIAVPTYPKHVPGNSSYAGIAKDWKNGMILSDSIPSRIIMDEFNYYVEIRHVFRKRFPGATEKELAHAILPLKEDKPNIVIIRTNILNKLDVCNITTDIFKLVGICKSNGVDQVHVSGITYRIQYVKTITEINNYLRGRQYANNYSFNENERRFIT